MKHKKFISIFTTLCVIAVAAVFMFNNPTSAEDRLLKENIEAFAQLQQESQYPFPEGYCMSMGHQCPGGRVICCMGSLGHDTLGSASIFW